MAWLVDELVRLGHEVTLFASGDSKTTAKLHAVWPRALRLGRPTDPMVAQAALLEAVARRANSSILSTRISIGCIFPLLSRLGVPFLTTCGFARLFRRGSPLSRPALHFNIG